MNILIIGSGGREHAIGKALQKSKHSVNIYTVGGWINPGLSQLGTCIIADITNNDILIDIVKSNAIDIAVIGSEDQLEQGSVDSLSAVGVFCIGPTREQTRLESNKVFGRSIIPEQYNPHYKVYTSPITNLDDWNDEYVVKAIGLCGGKGVKLSGDHLLTKNIAIEWCNELIEKDGEVLIEEKLFGEEFTILAFCDGKTIVNMPIVKDFKRLNDGDKGPNTGGMGCISWNGGSAPFLSDNDIAVAHQINHNVFEKIPGYIGILYGSFIKTADGIKVIEYNCRFGDPEAINVLELLETDLVDIFIAMRDGNLDKLDVKWSSDAIVTNYITVPGYPNNSEVQDLMIPFSENIIYAKITYNGDRFRMLGSRGYAMVSRGRTLKVAYQRNHSLLDMLDTTKCHFRRDIGYSNNKFSQQ